MNIRLLQIKDIPLVAKMHYYNLSDSFNSRIGTRHLEYLYRAMLEDPKSVVFVAHHRNKLAGAVSVTVDLKSFKKKIVKGITVFHLIYILIKLFTHPSLMVDFFREIGGNEDCFKDNTPLNPYLTSIFVNIEFRKTGLGRMLIEKIEEYFRRANIKSYYLDTTVDNPSRFFYEKLGFFQACKEKNKVYYVKNL